MDIGKTRIFNPNVTPNHKKDGKNAYASQLSVILKQATY